MTVRLVIIYRFRDSALIQVVCVVGDIHQTVPQDYIVDAMASEGNRFPPSCGNPVERSGISSDIGLAGGGRFGHHMCFWCPGIENVASSAGKSPGECSSVDSGC